MTTPERRHHHTETDNLSSVYETGRPFNGLRSCAFRKSFVQLPTTAQAATPLFI
jgi:hypothetical protein